MLDPEPPIRDRTGYGSIMSYGALLLSVVVCGMPAVIQWSRGGGMLLVEPGIVKLILIYIGVRMAIIGFVSATRIERVARGLAIVVFALNAYATLEALFRFI